MKTYDIQISGVQSANDELDAREISRLIPVLLQQQGIHINSIKVAERKS